MAESIGSLDASTGGVDYRVCDAIECVAAYCLYCGWNRDERYAAVAGKGIVCNLVERILRALKCHVLRKADFRHRLVDSPHVCAYVVNAVSYAVGYNFVYIILRDVFPTICLSVSGNTLKRHFYA